MTKKQRVFTHGLLKSSGIPTPPSTALRRKETQTKQTLSTPCGIPGCLTTEEPVPLSCHSYPSPASTDNSSKPSPGSLLGSSANVNLHTPSNTNIPPSEGWDPAENQLLRPPGHPTGLPLRSPYQFPLHHLCPYEHHWHFRFAWFWFG